MAFTIGVKEFAVTVMAECCRLHMVPQSIRVLSVCLSCAKSCTRSTHTQFHEDSSPNRAGFARLTAVMCAAGFNISLTPSFAASRLAFMLGYNAVFAVANLRYI